MSELSEREDMEERKERENIPKPLKRELRQEAVFGCVLCGSPIIDYHHIDFYCEVKEHKKENLVVLCTEHHRRANLKEIPKELLLKAKSNPYNKNMSSVSKDFYLFNKNTMKAGSNLFIDTPIILEIDNKPIISLKKEEGDVSLLNISYYDENNNLLAEVIDNEWVVHNPNEYWDIQYSPGHLKINQVENKVLTEFKIVDGIIELTAIICYNGFKMNIYPSRSIYNSNFKGRPSSSLKTHIDHCIVGMRLNLGSDVIEHKDSIFENCCIGISVQTK